MAVDAYDVFNRSDLHGDIALERMLAKLSTRRYSAGLEPVGEAVEALRDLRHCAATKMLLNGIDPNRVERHRRRTAGGFQVFSRLYRDRVW